MTPEERADALIDALDSVGMFLHPDVRFYSVEKGRTTIADALRAAAAAERETCAKVAETWCDPSNALWKTEYPDLAGCSAAFDEGQACTAPCGIAAAIRARGEGGE